VTLFDVKHKELIGASTDARDGSLLFGSGINIDKIEVGHNFTSLALDSFKVNNVNVTGDANISAYNSIKIDDLKVGENLDILSFEDGDIRLNQVYTTNGSVNISNENGYTEVNELDAGGDVIFKNKGESTLSVYSLNTRNNGSLYANVEDGELHLMNAYVDGEASIFNGKGIIDLRRIEVADELDARILDGSIRVTYSTKIGGDATLHSDNSDVILEDIEVGGNLKLSAKNRIYLDRADVGGSMLMKADDEECSAYTLNVGKDLIINTNTGFIKVEEALVGGNSYVSVDDEQGGNIKIKDIRTGTGSVGDLIVVSNSSKDGNQIKIENAVAANKLIINSFSNVLLKSAYALNGRLEVKAAGDLVAELISSAKDTFISTIAGTINVLKLISGDRLSVYSLMGGINIKDIETTNPDADIDIGIYSGDLNIANASSTRDLNFTSYEGKITLDTISSGGDISVTGSKSEINIGNSFASNNININSETGNVNINNTKAGNSLNAAVGGKTSITGSNFKNIDLTNEGETLIEDSSVNSMSVSNNGKLSVNNLKSAVEKLDLNNAGETLIQNSTITAMTASNDGELNINSITGSNLELTNNANAYITDSNIKAIAANNTGKLEVNSLTSDKLVLTNSGNADVIDSKISNVQTIVNSGEVNMANLVSAQMSSDIKGKLNISDSAVTKYDLKNSGETNITNSEITNINANNSGKLEVNSLTSDRFGLTGDGNTNIADSNIKSIYANNSGKLKANALTSDKLELTNSGNANITGSDIKSINGNNTGKLEVNNITSDNLKLASSGETKLHDSTIKNVNANISGGITEVNSLVSTQLSIVNSGNTKIANSSTNKINLTNSGKANLNNNEVNANANIVNKKGSLIIAKLDVAQNFDLDSKSGSINLSGIDVKNDFNFALAGNSSVKFADIKIGNDFNVYAGKAVLNGASLTVGNNMKTFTYSKYSAPKANLRAAVSSNNGTARASESDEGFTLFLDQLNIGGGLYVDNPDVTIKVKESSVGKDVDIDAGKENIQIDKLDVEGGSLDIKGSSGSVKLGEVTVDNTSNINLISGNLEVASLTSTLGIDFKAGGNITSSQSIETQTGSVNMVAGGSVDAYKVLANQQGNIEAVNGDIIIGQINGKTLVFKEDTNDRTLRVGEANVDSKIIAGADNIDIGLISQTGNENRLGIDFTRINGRAMDNVVIRDIKTDKGVEMNNLVSTYGNIHVSNEIFNLNNTYLLRKGDMSNSSIKFRLFGDNPVYSSDADIIAFFSPSRNHKDFANISFTNENTPEKQDYFPLTSKDDFKRMFNQYTVVQEIQSLHLAYEERVEDLSDDSFTNFDYRNLGNSKLFYVDPNSQIFVDSESVNLDDIDIPVGLEFDSASGELKAVGSQVKPQRAVD
jgi:hypothetical protein